MSAERQPYEAPTVREVALADMTPEQRLVAFRLQAQAARADPAQQEEQAHLRAAHEARQEGHADEPGEASAPHSPGKTDHEFLKLVPGHQEGALACWHALILRLIARGVPPERIEAFMHDDCGWKDPQRVLARAKFRFGLRQEQIAEAEKFVSTALWELVAERCELTVAAGSVELICAEDVEVRKIDWLWYARLLRRGIAFLEGPPEKGKSTILADIAARESQGHSFPGETVGREPGCVVMLVAEDDVETTVKPRLIAAGADLRRVHFLKATRDERGALVPLHLSDDCDRLRARCREVGATLVEVDPLVSYMGSRSGRMVETNNDLQVRKALLPLKDLAEDVGAVVLATRHYRKGRGTDAIEAGGGSIAFSGLARVLLAALPDPENAQQFLFAVAKNNLVPRSARPAIRYEIVPSDHDETIGRVRWGDAVEVSAGEILLAHAEQAKESPAAAKATAFLREKLASGEWVLASSVYESAEEVGLTRNMLRAARGKLGVQKQKRDRWYWRWPRQGALPELPGAGSP